MLANLKVGVGGNLIATYSHTVSIFNAPDHTMLCYGYYIVHVCAHILHVPLGTPWPCLCWWNKLSSSVPLHAASSPQEACYKT